MPGSGQRADRLDQASDVRHDLQAVYCGSINTAIREDAKSAERETASAQTAEDDIVSRRRGRPQIRVARARDLSVSAREIRVGPIQTIESCAANGELAYSVV